LTILVVFRLGYLLFGKTGGILGAIFLALSPWHLLFSRWADQGIFVPFFSTLSVCLLLDSLDRERQRGRLGDLEAVGAGFVGFLAFFSYAPAQLFIPLFLAVVGVSLFRRNRRVMALALVGFAIPTLPFAVYLAAGWGKTGARFQAISLLSGDQGIFEKVGVLALNYLKHLSPGFLFLRGDANLRHSVPGWGLLFPVDLVLLLAGIAALGRRGDWKTRIPLAGFFLAFVPASLTVEGIPHALRSIGALPWVQLICVAGLLEIIRIVSPLIRSSRAGKAPVFLIAGAIAFSSIRFNVEFFTLYPRQSYPYWEYGYRESMEALRRLRKPTDAITVTRYSEYPEAFFLFYWKPDPKEFQKEESLPGVYLPHWKTEPDKSRYESTLMLAYAQERVEGEELWRLNGPDGRPLWKIVRTAQYHGHPARE
jgi:4-amino-4-deoxy-L-arabinose transferase-like glycosyltransferase